jgi:hypothetical protein
MPRSLIVSMAVLASATVLGCGEQPVPSEPATLPPSFRTQQNPDGAGAQVVVFEAQGIFINDPDRDFSLWIGVPSSNAPECGGTGEVTGARVHVVSTPSDLERFSAHVSRQEMILYDHFTDDLCSLSDNDVIARGEGNARLGILSRTQDVLFGIQATGNLDLVSGGAAHLGVKGHFHIESDGTLRVHVDRFNLMPHGS